MILKISEEKTSRHNVLKELRLTKNRTLKIQKNVEVIHHQPAGAFASRGSNVELRLQNLSIHLT